MRARIGVIVSKWTASGQAVVARQIRSALDGLGHETFVLARPGSGPRAAAAEENADPVWDQPGVTRGSAHEMPVSEYEDWAGANGLELILFDENYQWGAVASLRAGGVRTVGRFVWEYFADEHVAPARDAYDVVYSMHRGERDRYAEMGIDSPLVRWGIHPELLRGGRAGARRVRRPLLLPGVLPRQAQADPQGRQGVRQGRGRAPAAARSTPRSPATTRSCTSGPKRTRGSS